jgi:hypothetical protein
MKMSLLRDIVFCNELAIAQRDHTRKCAAVVNIQKHLGGEHRYQVPEPWRGDIEKAPLLFVSSNPSIDMLDEAPWRSDPEEHICQYYQADRISKDFPNATYAHGKKSRGAVGFWKWVDARAVELYGESVIQGQDYAITEVVHCKSRDEHGVAAAMETCKGKFLRRVLELSRCKLIVSVGAVAEQAIQPLELAANLGRPVLYLAHPNSIKAQRAKTVGKAIKLAHWTETRTLDIRSVLREAKNAGRAPSIGALST